MKTNNKAYSFMVGAVVLCLFTIFSAFAPVHEGLHQAMQKMMQKMKAMKMTGDPDKDFSMMMIEHHQGAIDAANIVLKSGKDSKIKEMAQKTVQTQPQDQKDLRQHTQGQHDQNATAKKEESHAAHSQSSDANASSHNDQFTSELNKVMKDMETKMKNMKMSGDVDHDFATMMVDHHKAAIDMADAEIKHGRMDEVKSIAEKIKSDSQKDINELNTWLSSHGNK
jgi:uncharacterized protein (DUF305 family)